MKKSILAFLFLILTSFSSYSGEFDFQVEGDNWRIGIDKISEILYLAKYDSVTQRYKWKLNPDYSYNPNNFTAEQYFADFIDKANERLEQEYGQVVYPTGFADILQYLIDNSTEYNTATGELEVTN